jgi:SAM-dependent methyltransferase
MSLNPARDAEARDAWLARSRAAWNERAGSWDAMLEERPDQREQELQRAITALGLQPGMRVLDAGCGTGQWAVGFARHGCQVTAVDLAPSMLERARAHAQRAGVAIDFREGDIGRLPEQDTTFDVVHCRCVLQFAPDPVEVLRGFRRVLRPDGTLFVAVPGALSPIYDSSWHRFVEPDGFNTRIVPWELEALLDHLGWRIRDGWPSFGATGTGIANVLADDDAHRLPPRLQQAAATFWVTIATPDGESRDGAQGTPTLESR